MKFICILVPFAFIISCKPAPKQPTEPAKEYPADISAIFNHHGGIDQWQKMKSMTYEIVKEAGNEKQQIDLVSRRERIEGNNFLTGYDGEQVWLRADTSYKGNAIFYHNLILSPLRKVCTDYNFS